MRFSFTINYWRWLFAVLGWLGLNLLMPAADNLVLLLELAVAYFLAGYFHKWFKKTFFKPVLLFDLHNVLVAGDIEVEDLYERPGTRDLIRRLRQRYFVAAMTNFSPELFNFYGRKFGWFAEFDGLYYSGQYGIRKPDARVFGYVLRDLGVRASDVIFLDDRQANVVAAQKLGFKTVLFENASQTEKALRAMGIKTR